VPTGHIVYALGANLFAVPFDARKLQVTGGPVPVVEGVMRAAASNSAAAFFSISNNGSLVAVAGAALQSGAIISMVDTAGMKKPLALPEGNYSTPRISPDGTQVALQVDTGKEIFIAIYDLSGKAALRRLTFGGGNWNPLWTRDGKRIIFTSTREGGSDLKVFWQPADGSASAEKLTDEKGVIGAESVSPDGKTITVRIKGEINTLSPGGDRKMQGLIEPTLNTGVSTSTFSPDGKWVAYTQFGARTEVYVQPFPSTGAKYLVGSGGSPLWSPDGKQLFFLQPQASLFQIVAVPIQTQPTFVIGKATPLPIDGLRAGGAARTYDITPDGKQFIVTTPPEVAQLSGRSQQINVVLNWFTELQQRVPVK
jgi:serine/threonine-protein kinase